MKRLAALFVALVASSVPARASPDCMSLAEARAAFPGRYLSYRVVAGAHCWADHGAPRSSPRRRPVISDPPAPAPRLSVLWPVLAGAEPPATAALYVAEPMQSWPLLLDVDELTAPSTVDASGNQAADYCCWPPLEVPFAERWYAMPATWFLAAIGERLK